MKSKHLQDVGESYFEHFFFSTVTSIKLLSMGVVLFIHGLIPDIFVKTASNKAVKLIEKLAKRQQFAKDEE